MISRAGGLRAGQGRESALGWWLAPAGSLLWRVPLLLVLSALTVWFALRALVHLAFLFDRHPVSTFLLAPLLMPFAAIPALCFLLLIRTVPRLWRRGNLSPGQRGLLVAGGPLVALVLAVMVDLLHINLLRLAGIPLPRLPLDPS
jgi:hypothetical protein